MVLEKIGLWNGREDLRKVLALVSISSRVNLRANARIISQVEMHERIWLDMSQCVG